MNAQGRKRVCCDCGASSRQEELRPYGPRGQLICFRCANASPERKEEAQRQMRARFDAIEGPVGLTAHGPMAVAQAVAKLTCLGCGRLPSTTERIHLAVRGAEAARAADAGPTLPTISWFCSDCRPPAAPVCVRCSQPIAEGDAACELHGRPAHLQCPDWLDTIRSDKADRQAAADDELVAQLDAQLLAGRDELLAENDGDPTAAALMPAYSVPMNDEGQGEGD